MKRFIFLTIVPLFFSYFAQAVTSCGTVIPESYQHHLMTKDRSYLLDNSRAGGTLYVPIQYHIIGDNQGVGYYKVDHLIEVHCRLNERYEGANIYFYFYDDIHFIDNSNFYEFSGNFSGNQMMNQYNVANVCNVYINEDPNGVCGYAYFPNSGPNGGGIVCSKSCSDPVSTTLAHEMGHYMGLPHTFSTIGGVEYVDGSNCSNSGDWFCDTPADFLDYRWSCPYTGDETDPHGDFYRDVLDETFYMSYSSDDCQDKFSPLQEIEMYQVLQNERPYLLNHPVPSLDALVEADLIYPASGANNITANYVPLSWNRVEGADYYHVILTRFVNLSFANVNSVVSDTFLLVDNLQAGYTYRWRIKPFSHGNTCTNYSPESNFTTSEIVPNFNITQPTCAGWNDAAVNIELTGGSPPFSYEWSNGVSVNPATDLEAGFYEISITDGNGDEFITGVNIEEPDELLLQIDGSVGNLIANAAGGLMPYFYTWSDGVSGNTNTTDNPGNLSVTVTDALGCEATKSFVSTGTELELKAIVNELKIFPNPASKSGKIHLEITSGSFVVGELSVYSVIGNEMLRIETAFVRGSSFMELEVTDFSQGVYLVKLEIGLESITRRLSIIQ